MKSKDNIFELETRKKIHDFVLKYPGLHFRELSRKLKIPRGTLDYHLNYLQRKGYLTAKNEGKYTLYYGLNNIGHNQKKMLHIFRQENTRHIILYLFWCGCASQAELSKSLEKYPTTIAFHLKKLIENDVIEPAPVDNGKVHVNMGGFKIIERNTKSNEIIYRLKDPYFLYDSFLRYKKLSLDDKYIKCLSPDFSLYHTIFGKPTQLKNFKDYIGLIEKKVYKVFPHPYHV